MSQPITALDIELGVLRCIDREGVSRATLHMSAMTMGWPFATAAGLDRCMAKLVERGWVRETHRSLCAPDGTELKRIPYYESTEAGDAAKAN